MKSAAEQLTHRPILGLDTFVRPPGTEEIKPDPSGRYIQVSLFELIDAFERIIQNMPGEHGVDFDTERFSIKDKIAHIIEVLEERGSVTFDELFSKDADKEELIATFLALLEMGKLSLVRIVQHYQSGAIRLFYL
jgi:segregation and condensation protein A